MGSPSLFLSSLIPPLQDTDYFISVLNRPYFSDRHVIFNIQVVESPNQGPDVSPIGGSSSSSSDNRSESGDIVSPFLSVALGIICAVSLCLFLTLIKKMLRRRMFISAETLLLQVGAKSPSALGLELQSRHGDDGGGDDRPRSARRRLAARTRASSPRRSWIPFRLRSIEKAAASKV